MASRPLSPHIFVYRFAYTMATSIFHRATGLALSASLLLLVAWLAALAGGAQAYARFADFAGSGPVKFVLALVIVSFCYHLANGVRHLLWDASIGMERPQARRSAVIVVVVTLLLAALLVYLFLCRGVAS